MFKMMIDNGFDSNVKSNDGRTVSYEAFQNDAGAVFAMSRSNCQSKDYTRLYTATGCIGRKSSRASLVLDAFIPMVVFIGTNGIMTINMPE